MLINDIEPPYTVEMLLEITSSQLCCFGDHYLKLSPSPKQYQSLVEFVVGDAVILTLGRAAKMKRAVNTLSDLVHVLGTLPENALVDAFGTISDDFAVGFSTKHEGFVEVFHISDLAGIKQAS